MSAEPACTICAAPGPPTARWRRIGDGRDAVVVWLCSGECWDRWAAPPPRPKPPKAVKPPKPVVVRAPRPRQLVRVVRDVPPASFAATLQRYRERAGLSCNELARAAGCNPSYITRLERGDREPPRRPVVAAIAQAVGVQDAAAVPLYLSAGYLPADDTVALVARILSDGGLSADTLARYRELIRLASEQTQATAGQPARDGAA